MNTVQLAKHFAASFSCSVLMIGSKLIVSNRQNKRVLVPDFKEMCEEDARKQLKMAVKTLKLNRIVSHPVLVIDNKEVITADYEEPTHEEMFG